MWKKWRRLKRDTKIRICNAAAGIALMCFLISAAGIETGTAASFLCATFSLGALSFFAWLAGWLK